MAIIPKDPLDWLTLFRQQMNEIFNFLTILETEETVGEREYTPLIDIFETADRFMVEVELPGFDLGDISLSICCNMLVVEGVKKQDYLNRGSTYLCLERHFGRFRRGVEIPPAFDVAGVKASYNRGVLRVSFPRHEGKGVVIRDIPIVQGDGDGSQS